MVKYIAMALFLLPVSCMQKISKAVTPAMVNNATRIKIFANDTIKSTIQYAGFGYDIYVKDQLYIHQPGIPAISENKGFYTADAAQKTAQLIAFKIQNNILPPSVSTRELDSLGVLNGLK
ncbi:MAG: DUF4907 domain-containing protein [Ginsengibacter sp.]